MLAKCILCGLSRSCCTKKGMMIKSLFHFLILDKIYQLKSRHNCLLLLILTNQCLWISVIKCLYITYLKDILVWLIKILLEYVCFNISWLWGQILDFSVDYTVDAFLLLLSLYIASGKITSSDNRTGGEIIIVFKMLCLI